VVRKIKVAIIGSGNIGTDLMIKIMRTSATLSVAAMVGIDAASDGLARAERLGVAVTHLGIEGLLQLAAWPDIDIVFDATSAGAHRRHSDICNEAGKVMIDLTPAAIGPFVVPVVNGDAHLDAPNVNMVTCGGQATIPIVAAVASVAKVTMPKSSPPFHRDRPGPAPAPISMSSPKPRRGESKWSAAPPRARRLS
jgi:acetaldehyde dehydrogenase